MIYRAKEKIVQRLCVSSRVDATRKSVLLVSSKWIMTAGGGRPCPSGNAEPYVWGTSHSFFKAQV